MTVEANYKKAHTVAMISGLQISSKDYKRYAEKLPGLT